MAKTQYFNPTDFVDRVLTTFGFHDLPADQKAPLAAAIERQLRDRLTVTILDSFDEKDLEMVQKLLQDHPELDHVEAVSLMALNMPGLHEKMQTAIEELYEELIYDAQRVDEAVKMREQKPG